MDSEPDEFEKTMIITPGSAVAAAAAKKASAIAPAPAPVAAKPSATLATGRMPAQGGEAPVALPKAKLQVLSGAFAGRELELNKALTTLGRPGVQVAAITRRADGFFIVHVDSGKPGDYPSVNGTAIGEQARKLQDNDVILLAGVKMGFFEG
jgi:hypothetical protein